MNIEDPVVVDILKRSMVARIATLSSHGRPSVNPLYFIFIDGTIWLGTADWTLAARNVRADPRVSLLFNVEKDPGDPRVLRISGQARVRVGQEAVRAYAIGIVRKNILTPGGVFNMLSHPRRLWLRRYYTAQSREKGPTCVIEVRPEKIDLIKDQA